MKSFEFKNFNLFFDNKNVFPLTTDAVLLASVAFFENPKKILDIGCGSGILTLAMASKYPKAQVYAIDVNSFAVKTTLENINLNPHLTNKFYVLHEDLKNFYKKYPLNFDLIISNPPFFENELKNESPISATARHNLQLDYKNLVNSVNFLLSSKGNFFVIIPHKNCQNFIYTAALSGLIEFYRLKISPKKEKDFNRCILGFSKIVKPYKKDFLWIEEKNKKFSDKFKSFTRDIYKPIYFERWK